MLRRYCFSMTIVSRIVSERKRIKARSTTWFINQSGIIEVRWKTIMNNTIDFVVTWVDGGDPIWQADKAKYSTVGADIRNARFRDWDQLKYWFRSVERYAPWVNKIHFVTYGHLPDWLDINNPKLHIVNHKDFIPTQYLPVFNSTAIEVHLHRIPDLSEQFVYFCDDIYLMKPCKPNDFFKGGRPADMPILAPVLPHQNEMYFYHLYNDYSLYSQYISKRRMISVLPKYVNPKYGYVALTNIINLLAKNVCFRSLHLSISLLKRTMEELWNEFPDELEKTATSRFRQITNNSLELFRGYQLITGNFYPIYKKGIVLDTTKTDMASSIIKDCPYKFMCLSDNSSDDDFEKQKTQLNESFEMVFPERCSFER